MRSRQRPAKSHASPLTDARQGLAYCRSQPWLWITIIGAGLANFVSLSPLGVLIPLMVHHVLRGGGIALGLVLAAGGAGGIVSTIVVGRTGLPLRPVMTMWIGWTLAGLFAASLGLAPNVWVLGPLCAMTYGLTMYGNSIWYPLLQQRVPAHLLGRVSSVDWLASSSLSPLGIIAAGGLAAVIGTRATLIGGGILCLLTGLSLLAGGVGEKRT